MSARWTGREMSYRPPAGQRSYGISYALASHLVRRFCGALWPGGPRRFDVGWVTEVLTPAELCLWAQLSGPDRRHSVAVARRAAAADRGSNAGVESQILLSAALLHDVGKLEAGLGTFARVGTTLAALALGRSRLADWSGRRPVPGKVGRYLCHDRLGADLLRAAGSHPLVVSWAAQHHLPPDRWDLPPGMGAILKAADND